MGGMKQINEKSRESHLWAPQCCRGFDIWRRKPKCLVQGSQGTPCSHSLNNLHAYSRTQQLSPLDQHDGRSHSGGGLVTTLRLVQSARKTSSIFTSCEWTPKLREVKPVHPSMKPSGSVVTCERGLKSRVVSPVHPLRNPLCSFVTCERGLKSTEVSPAHPQRKVPPTSVTCEKGLKSTEVSPVHPNRKELRIAVICERGLRLSVVSPLHW